MVFLSGHVQAAGGKSPDESSIGLYNVLTFSGRRPTHRGKRLVSFINYGSNLMIFRHLFPRSLLLPQLTWQRMLEERL